MCDGIVPPEVRDALHEEKMLGSPLWILSFALFAALAPAPDLRRRMLAALVIEFAIAACGLVHFMATQPPI